MQYMNQTEYARHRGITQQRVSQLIHAGYLDGALKKIGGRFQIDPEKADKLLAENLDPARCKNSTEPDPAEQKQTIQNAGLTIVPLAEANKLRANYEAALKKLELEEKQGDLIPKVTVEKEAFEMARRVRDALLNIPNRISAELATITDQHMVSLKLTEEITQALEELSQ